MYIHLGSLMDGVRRRFRAVHLVPAILLPVVAAAALTLIPAYADDLSPAPGSQILFTSDRDSVYGDTTQIYTMNADGSGQTNLSRNVPKDETSPVLSPDGAHIAFVSDLNGDHDIYIMNADGSGRVNITRNASADFAPVWSPDGKRIAFVSNRDGRNEIYVMGVDGSGQTRLTVTLFGIRGVPVWSPDGTRIVYALCMDDTPYQPETEIHVMNSDGSNPVRLTTNPYPDWAPAWSPDGTRIAFASFRNNAYGIYSMDVNGDNLVYLAYDVAGNLENPGPVWSPDGARISYVGAGSRRRGQAYVMNADGSNPIEVSTGKVDAITQAPTWSADGKRVALVSHFGIYVVDLDGNNFTKVTQSDGWDSDPVWSLDGTRITFASRRDTTIGATRDLYKMNSDGSHVVRLTYATRPFEFNSGGEWSPDGRHIAFVSSRGDQTAVYIMDSDGSGQRRLSYTELGGFDPAWSPDGRRIIFETGITVNREIYAINLDGTGQTNLTAHPAEDVRPAWSPDGTRILFLSNRDDPDDGFRNEVYVMNSDGSGVTRISEIPNYYMSRPAWSPDGTRIVFTAASQERSGVYLMTSDGNSLAYLARSQVFLEPPAWSPDGTRIAYIASDGETREVFVMNADGSNMTRLTYMGPVENPLWSPDGAWLIFVVDTNTQHDFYLMDANGGNIVNLSNNTGLDSDPHWSP